MNNRTILIVDDESVWLRLLRRLFIYHGYSVVTASSCAEGVAAAGRVRPDCAILDFNLGDGTAEAVCDAVRSGRQHGKPPVIIFSFDPAAAGCLVGESRADILVAKDTPLGRLPGLMDMLFVTPPPGIQYRP